MSEWSGYEFYVHYLLNGDVKCEVHVSILHISRIISKVSSINIGKDRYAGEWGTSLMLYFRPDVVGK